MLNVGGPEVVVILLVALLVLGPKDLPRVMRALGKAQAEVKKFTGLLQAQAQTVMEPLTSAMQDVTAPTPTPTPTPTAAGEAAGVEPEVPSALSLVPHPPASADERAAG